MVYADDITLFSTTVQELQNQIDVYVAYSKRWRFKYGVEKSKCAIVGKCPLNQKPKWSFGDKCLSNEESLTYLVMCLIVILIMPAMWSIDNDMQTTRVN